MNPDYRDIKADFDFRFRDTMIDTEYMAGPEVCVKVTFRNIDKHPSQLSIFLTLEQAEKLSKLLE